MIFSVRQNPGMDCEHPLAQDLATALMNAEMFTLECGSGGKPTARNVADRSDIQGLLGPEDYIGSW